MCITYSFQEELLKNEMDHDEAFEDSWMNIRDEGTDFVGKDVFCTGFGYARFSKGMEEKTGVGMKSSLTLTSSG